MDKTSYALGMVIAHNLRGMGVETLATEDFAAAVQAVLGGQKTALTDTEAQITVQQYLQKKEEEQSKAQRAEGENIWPKTPRKKAWP